MFSPIWLRTVRRAMKAGPSGLKTVFVNRITQAEGPGLGERLARLGRKTDAFTVDLG